MSADSEEGQLAAVMERHGKEWEDKGTHDKHLSVLDFKKEQGQVEQQEQRLKELAPAVRNMEQLAAHFSDDPEQIIAAAWAVGKRQVLPGEKGQAPTCQDRQEAALPVSGLC